MRNWKKIIGGLLCCTFLMSHQGYVYAAEDAEALMEAAQDPGDMVEAAEADDDADQASDDAALSVADQAFADDEQAAEESTGEVLISGIFRTGSYRDNKYIPPAEDPKAAIEALRTEYPEGMVFTDETHVYWSNGRYYYSNGSYSPYGGSGCHAFALILSDAAFGSLPIVEHTDFDDLNVGDAIRINNDRHTVIVTDIDGDTITVAQANYRGKVHWDETMSRTDHSDWDFIVTRRRLNIADITETHSYDREPKIRMGALKEGQDYTVSYTDRDRRSKCVATVVGINNFYGQRQISFADEDPISGFVTRMYRIVLGREPDEAGLEDWSENLESGRDDAVDIVQGFFCSSEYAGKGKSNEETVTDCYNAMLDRDPDTEGFNNWVTRLENGMSIEAIFAGFVESPEFSALCDDYGISPGSYPVTEERDKNAGVTMFVSRLYKEALGRNYDIDGLNYWCRELNTDSSKGNVLKVASDGFFHSEEFLGRGLDNAEFVKVCYRTFLGREYDEQGLETWTRLLDSGGKTRDEVVEGFAYSDEFFNIMAQYGL